MAVYRHSVIRNVNLRSRIQTVFCALGCWKPTQVVVFKTLLKVGKIVLDCLDFSESKEVAQIEPTNHR